MALSKLYYTEANCVADDTSTAKLVTASLLFALKTLPLQLKTGTNGTSGAPPAGAAWEMWWSTDGVTAGAMGDGVDHLGADTFDGAKWVRAAAASPHSGFVLRSPAGICAALPAARFFLIVDWGTPVDSQINIILCKAEPTGGTVSARPTSTDECSTLAMTMTDVTVAGHRLHFVTDAVGNFYVAMSRNGNGDAHAFVGILQLEAPGLSAGDLFPMVLISECISSGRGSLSGTPFVGSTGATAAGGGTKTRSPLNFETYAPSSGCGIIWPVSTGFATSTSLNEATGKSDAMACLVLFDGNATSCSIKGTIPDWYLQNASRAVGSCEPAAGASERILIGHFWVPNGGVAFAL